MEFGMRRRIGTFPELLGLLESSRETKRSSEERTIILVDDGDEELCNRGFEIAEHDKAWIESEILDFLAKNPGEDASLEQRQSYRIESNSMMAKIRAYAHCLPLHAKDSFKGYCDGCYEVREISIEDREVFTNCPECKPRFG